MPTTTATRSALIAWTCRHCQQPIEDGTGWITIERSDAWQHERAMREWRDNLEDPRFIRGTELDAMPDVAHWQITHSKCDPIEDVTGYTIDIERIRTERDLLDWTGHLMEKTWIGHTDWDHVIRKAIGGKAL